MLGPSQRTRCPGLAWQPMGRAGPASSRHQRPPAVSSLTSRCSPWCPMCSTSRLSTPGASAAASCRLSQSTSVSRGSGGVVEGPPCSCSYPQHAHLPPVRMRSCPSLTDPVGSTFTIQQESTHFSPLLSPYLVQPPSPPTWTSGSPSILVPYSCPHPHLSSSQQPPEGACEHSSQVPSWAPALFATVCPPRSSHQRAPVSTRVRSCPGCLPWAPALLPTVCPPRSSHQRVPVSTPVGSPLGLLPSSPQSVLPTAATRGRL